MTFVPFRSDTLTIPPSPSVTVCQRKASTCATAARLYLLTTSDSSSGLALAVAIVPRHMTEQVLFPPVARADIFTGKTYPLPSHLTRPAQSSKSTDKCVYCWIRERDNWQRPSRAPGNFWLRFHTEHVRNILIAGEIPLSSETFDFHRGGGGNNFIAGFWPSLMFRAEQMRCANSTILTFSWLLDSLRLILSVASVKAKQTDNKKQFIRPDSWLGWHYSQERKRSCPIWRTSCTFTNHKPNRKFSRAIVASVWPRPRILFHRSRV